MLADLRFAARFLSKVPWFTGGIIALLALGVAANIVIFSLVDALLLRPLPVRDPERLVMLVSIRPPLPPKSDFLYEEYENWRKSVPGFEDVLAWSAQDMYVRTGDLTERGRIHFVSDNFFSALGTPPARGRLLQPEDQQAATGTAPIVLSFPYWQRRFGGDPTIVGRNIELDGQKVLVVGVTPKGFNGLTVETGPDVHAPVGWLKALRPNLEENKIYCEVAARLRNGFAAESVRQQAEAIWRTRWKELNATDPGLAGRFVFEPAERGVSRMRTQFKGVLWLLMGGVALLMLMVCANVAGLLMARSSGRQGELAIRLAIGASRFRIVRQLFCEAFLLMVGGAGAAMALALLAMPFMADLLPPVRDFGATRLQLSLDLTPDWRILGFTIGTSAVAVLLFGLVPAFNAVKQDLHPLLKEARTGGWRGRQMLVALQVALCTVLLVGAGVTLLTLQRLDGMDAGFKRSRIVTFSVDPAMARYKPEQTVELQRRLLLGAKDLPGVESAASAGRGLMRGTGVKLSAVRAGEQAGPSDFLNASVNAISPEYFATMGIEWIAGRNFTGREDPLARPMPVIVNESFVKRIGRGQPVLGMKFGSAAVGGTPAKPSFEPIGIVRDAKYRSLREPFQPIVYQLTTPGDSFIMHLRTTADPATVIAPMRQLLSRIDPRLSYLEVTTLENEVAASLWAERVAAFLATLLALAAGLIVAAGLYALIAFVVAQRRREIGIRVALGALPRNIVLLMLTRAIWLAFAGIALGLLGSWLVLPQIAPILYEVNPRDFGVLSQAAALVLFVTCAAALVPSLTALRLHPASVLRQE